MTFDLAGTEFHFADLISEQENATLNDAALLGGRLLLTFIVDAKFEIRRYLSDGTPDGMIGLPGIGTAGGFRGRPDEDEAFFVFTGHNAPTNDLPL